MHSEKPWKRVTFPSATDSLTTYRARVGNETISLCQGNQPRSTAAPNPELTFNLRIQRIVSVAVVADLRRCRCFTAIGPCGRAWTADTTRSRRGTLVLASDVCFPSEKVYRSWKADSGASVAVPKPSATSVYFCGLTDGVRVDRPSVEWDTVDGTIFEHVFMRSGRSCYDLNETRL